MTSKILSRKSVRIDIFGNFCRFFLADFQLVFAGLNSFNKVSLAPSALRASFTPHLRLTLLFGSLLFGYYGTGNSHVLQLEKFMKVLVKPLGVKMTFWPQFDSCVMRREAVPAAFRGAAAQIDSLLQTF